MSPETPSFWGFSSLLHPHCFRLQDETVGHRVVQIAEVGRHFRAVGEAGLLDRAVFREDPERRHFVPARLFGHGHRGLGAFEDLFLEFLVVFPRENVHRRDPVKSVEKVALHPEAREFVIVVAPVPVRNGAVVVNQFPERHPVRLTDLVFGRAFGSFVPDLRNVSA